jgi:hypothetical protein
MITVPLIGHVRAPRQIAVIDSSRIELVLDHTVKMVLKPLHDIYICISAIIFEDDCRRLASSSRIKKRRSYSTFCLKSDWYLLQYTHYLLH